MSLLMLRRRAVALQNVSAQGQGLKSGNNLALTVSLTSVSL